MISFWITILTIVSSIVAQYYPNPNAYGNQYPAQPSYGFHRNITNPYPAPAPYPAPYPGNPPPYPVNPQPYPAARPTYGFKRNNTNNATDAGSSPTTFIIGVKGNGDQLLQQIPVFKKPGLFRSTAEKIIDFRPDRTGFPRRITSIEVRNNARDGTVPSVKVIRGGIGKNYAEIKLKSEDTPINVTVLFFGHTR